MRPVKSFIVKASLPKVLEPLREIAYNMWWYWNIHAVKLFYRIDRVLWEEYYHNPVQLLGSIPQEKFLALALGNIIPVIVRLRRFCIVIVLSYV